MMRSLSKIMSLIRKLHSKVVLSELRKIKGLTIGKEVTIWGKPIIDVRNGGNIIIGDHVLLSSMNVGYHINMFGPVKLYADKSMAKIVIHEHTQIYGSCLHAFLSIEVGKRCLIAANSQIFDGNGHDSAIKNGRINICDDSKKIILEDDVWIGANSIILPGVTIGKGSIIGAGSVVTKDVPSMVMAAGNPLRIVKSIEGT